MAKYDEIIERLEKASEGSRELDAAIASALRWPISGKGTVLPDWVHANFLEWEITRDGLLKAGCLWEPVPFTTSLDAARSLIPAGRAWRTEYLPAGTWPHRIWLMSDDILPLADECGRPTLGKTEALATCAAAGRARQHREGDQ